MTAIDITIHASFLRHDDPDASLVCYRDTLSFEVRDDVGYEGMRWITVGPVDQPSTSIVLHPLAADPGITDDERRTIVEMRAKGTYVMASPPNYPLAIAAFSKAYRLDPRRKVRRGRKPGVGLFEVPKRLSPAYRLNGQLYET